VVAVLDRLNEAPGPKVVRLYRLRPYGKFLPAPTAIELNPTLRDVGYIEAPKVTAVEFNNTWLCAFGAVAFTVYRLWLMIVSQ
jgi:hypothetical protein